MSDGLYILSLVEELVLIEGSFSHDTMSRDMILNILYFAFLFLNSS